MMMKEPLLSFLVEKAFAWRATLIRSIYGEWFGFPSSSSLSTDFRWSVGVDVRWSERYE